jgi:hypothetical protein
LKFKYIGPLRGKGVNQKGGTPRRARPCDHVWGTSTLNLGIGQQWPHTQANDVNVRMDFATYYTAFVRAQKDFRVYYLSQTPEGYISKDIYILSFIQKSAKRIFHNLFWSGIF